MREDPIAVLERELVQAARRRGAPRRQRRIAGGLAMAAALLVALAIAAGALLLLGGHKGPPSAGAGVPGRQALIDELGVLRRAQTKADLGALIRPNARFGKPDVPLIRRAAVTPWGQTVFFVPVRPRAGRGQEALWVLIGPRGFSECCVTASELSSQGIVNNAGQATGHRIGHGVARARFFAVVPDGVAKVRIGRLVMAVHDNVAAAQADPRLVGPTPAIFWFGPRGNVLRRIGDLAGSYRSVASPVVR